MGTSPLFSSLFWVADSLKKPQIQNKKQVYVQNEASASSELTFERKLHQLRLGKFWWGKILD